MVDLSSVISKEVTEIQRIDRQGDFDENHAKGLCFGLNGFDKYLVVAIKRCKLICTFLNYEEVSLTFPRCDINDISEEDYLAYYLGQKIKSISFHNDLDNSNKSYFFITFEDFTLRFSNSELIELNNANN